MPHRLALPCRQPGCPNLNCQVHTVERQDVRPPAAVRGYDYRWQRLRLMFLRAHPICQCEDGCTQAATDVHHKVPLDEGGKNEWDNLQALCHSHHSKKTAREHGQVAA